MNPRLRLIAGAFLIAIAVLVFHQFFATAVSNRCDPGNSQFSMLKSQGVMTFRPSGTLLTWENDGPDNSWICSEASLSISYIGAQLKSMFDATRAEMSSDGWTGGEIFLKDQNFASYEKEVGGVRLEAVVRKQALWIEVDMNAPGLHLGEPGF